MCHDPARKRNFVPTEPTVQGIFAPTAKAMMEGICDIIENHKDKNCLWKIEGNSIIIYTAEGEQLGYIRNH